MNMLIIFVRHVRRADTIAQGHLDDVLAHFLRVLDVIREGLGVGDYDECFLVLAGILQFHPAEQEADVAAYMQPAYGLVTGEDDFRGFPFLFDSTIAWIDESAIPFVLLRH